jgi:hypothetical protein
VAGKDQVDQIENRVADYRRSLISTYLDQGVDLLRLIHTLEPAHVHHPIETGGWSPHQVMAHLRDVELQAYQPRLTRVLTEDRPCLANFDEAQWMVDFYDRGEPITAMAEQFAAGRRAGHGDLARLPSQAWSRLSYHPTVGEKTFGWWVEKAVLHAQEHRQQLTTARRVSPSSRQAG